MGFKNFLKKTIQYLLGFFFFLETIFFLDTKPESFLSGIISLACALVILPITRNFLEKILNFNFGKGIKYSLPFIGFIFPPLFCVSTIKNDDHLNNYSNSKIFKDSINTNVNNFISQTSINSAYDDKKNDKVQASNLLTSASTKNSSYKKVNRSTAKVKKSYAFSKKINKSSKNKVQNGLPNRNFSSGLCGHANKSGGFCKRRVKGGGYCWQHR